MLVEAKIYATMFPLFHKQKTVIKAQQMIDLHMHTFFSDGELIPSELLQRARAAGYTAMAITDHADSSNIEHILTNIVKFVNDIQGHTDITVIPGVELTHVQPSLIPHCVKLSRKFGAKIVAVHGETVVEPVAPGTNRAAIEAGVDFLAHPGLISEEDVLLASEKGIYLELTTRRGHSLTNGHVARLAQLYRANLILNTDSHSPGDLLSQSLRRAVIRGSGLDNAEMEKVLKNSADLVESILQKQ